MSALKANIAANFGGSVWAGIMSLVFAPLYIHFMGIEAYGLIGIFIIIQALSSLLDMGIGNTLNREMARYSVHTNKAQDMRDLLRTLEIIYWGIGLIVVLIVFLSAPYISHKWVHGKQIFPAAIEQAILIMGISAALQGVSGFYSGGLLGLQRQVLLNVVNGIIVTLRGAGAVTVLWLVSPTIQAFFIWQLIVSVLQVYILENFLWHRLPGHNLKPVFRLRMLKEVSRFTIGVGGITIMGIILTQIDKVILSGMLSLDMFGYYVLASTVAMGLYRLIGPVSSAVYPRFSQLVALENHKKLALLYHQSSQLMSVLILPCAVTVAFFSREILYLWQQNPSTIEHTHLLLSILVTGTALNGLLGIPYILQLASGWIKLGLYMNLTAILVLVPLIYYLAKFYGAIGAAYVWVILNSFALLAGIHLMHIRLLRGEEKRWWVDDIVKPLFPILLTAFAGKVFINTSLSFFRLSVYLFFLFLCATFLSIVACSHLRNKMLDKLRFMRGAMASLKVSICSK